MLSSLEDVFVARMLGAGWQSVRDVHDIIYAWDKEERRVAHAHAYQYWKLSGRLPVDSLDVGERSYLVMLDPGLDKGDLTLLVGGKILHYRRVGDEEE